MTKPLFEAGPDFAQQMDQQDPLAEFRHRFHIPKAAGGTDAIYLCGNSLGLQPTNTAEYVNEELDKWRDHGVHGHFEGAFPWMPYHEFLTPAMAKLVGGEESEVVVMNSLTVNLHLMMVSFYRPTPERHKILIEGQAFPSDWYAVQSQISFHGFDPAQSTIVLEPRKGEETIRHDALCDLIEREGDEIALILLPGVQYYTGQVFDMAALARLGHEKGCMVGFDLAHAVGNIPLHLHDWDADFAVWCTYKYLNAGPGAVGGCLVHDRHGEAKDLPRLSGWWGHHKSNRFEMVHPFQASSGAEGWQLSNPPIFSLAAIRASLDVFSDAGFIQPLRQKSELLTGYLRHLLQEELGAAVKIITPEAADEHGCQLSLCVQGGKAIYEKLDEAGVVSDWREPDVIRVAPVPLYNSFEDCYRFVTILKSILGNEKR